MIANELFESFLQTKRSRTQSGIIAMNYTIDMLNYIVYTLN